MILISKENLVAALLSYGEDELAEKAKSLTDEQMIKVGELAGKYMGRHSLIDKCCACGAILYFEGRDRDLRRNRRIMKYYDQVPKETDGFFSRYLKILLKK